MAYNARVVCDSIGPHGIRLITIEVTYPRFVHSELLTHRVFSRNSSSSRAIPIEKMIQRVISDPVMPVSWGKNQRGMQAGADLSGDELAAAQIAWLRGRDAAVETARAMATAGLHKQVVNRVLEPWMWITTLITATEWDNFFAQRCHPDAQPETRVAAELIRGAMAASVPTHRRWHMPYITADDDEFDLGSLPALSVARCARVSYLTHDGKRDPEADLDLHGRLIKARPPQWSPFEHVAEVAQTTDFIGNFRGWRQYRKFFSDESGQRR